MSAPYRNFWIIVGMTMAAVVFANMAAKPKSNRTSSYSDPTRSSQTSTQSTIESKPLATPTMLPQAGPSASQDVVNREPVQSQQSSSRRDFRSIDADIKTAFDEAAQIALTMPTSSKNEKGNAKAETSLSDLPAREIKSIPVVTEVPGSQAVPNAPGAKTTTNLNMREGPGPQYVLVTTLATDTSVVVMETEAGWVHIRVKETGQDGWVNPRYLLRD